MERAITLTAVFGLFIGLLAVPASAALTSGVYQTLPGATVIETGERVPNKSRVVPISARFTLDLDSAPPSLTAVITDAVLEGGEPFPLTVRGSPGIRLADGTYRFSGDYLRELYPTGTQYGFEWRFSASTNGEVLWNGSIAWWGGHIWYVGLTNHTLVPNPGLEIARAGSKVTVSWPAASTGYVLEQAADLPATKWSTVKDPAELIGDRLFLTTDDGDCTDKIGLHLPSVLLSAGILVACEHFGARLCEPQHVHRPLGLREFSTPFGLGELSAARRAALLWLRLRRAVKSA